ncbi:unnamed protein product [Ambrosiozyma monospora]|uniref:Unnamed protein product n=1 Tax=Ambrosiozyma monospora TaxID=43982 RepID=A0ACB5SQL4_AMBMO|nr:unnamed protein product [Ambrosiozyma monospora]
MKFSTQSILAIVLLSASAMASPEAQPGIIADAVSDVTSHVAGAWETATSKAADAYDDVTSGVHGLATAAKSGYESGKSVAEAAYSSGESVGSAVVASLTSAYKSGQSVGSAAVSAAKASASSSSDHPSSASKVSSSSDGVNGNATPYVLGGALAMGAVLLIHLVKNQFNCFSCREVKDKPKEQAVSRKSDHSDKKVVTTDPAVPVAPAITQLKCTPGKEAATENVGNPSTWSNFTGFTFTWLTSNGG